MKYDRDIPPPPAPPMLDQKFRKKPIVVLAVRARDAMFAAEKDWRAMPPWLAEVYERGGVVFSPDGVHLPTLEGTMLASPDDWIIYGVKGEVYPCKPDIFATTYEPVL